MDWNTAMNQAKRELGYFNDEYIEDFDEVIILAKNILYDWKEENWEECESERESKKKRYHIYLKSDKWKALRHYKLEVTKYKCKDCGGKATEVHHKEYRNFGNPWEFYDLVSLCISCHKKRHGLK